MGLKLKQRTTKEKKGKAPEGNGTTLPLGEEKGRTWCRKNNENVA